MFLTLSGLLTLRESSLTPTRTITLLLVEPRTVAISLRRKSLLNLKTIWRVSWEDSTHSTAR
jgi:hypothetical protein